MHKTDKGVTVYHILAKFGTNEIKLKMIELLPEEVFKVAANNKITVGETMYNDSGKEVKRALEAKKLISEDYMD